MAQLLSSYLQVDKKKLEQKGVFDAVIGLDTRLFLDPHLLKKTKIPDFKKSRDEIKKYYSDIIRLLLVYRKTKKRRPLQEALKRLTFKETKGVFIGYGIHGGDGNAIGPDLARRLLDTALDILDMGIYDPEIFELIGLFEEDFGADRLSDMTIAIIRDDIYSYTERIAQELTLREDKLIDWREGEKVYKLLKHPAARRPIIFLPQELLRDLPVALDREGIDHVVATNEELRRRLNRMIGAVWKSKLHKLKKKDLRYLIFSDKKNISELINAYKISEADHYDFEDDPAGEVKWFEIGNEFAKSNPLQLQLKEKNLDELEQVVRKIVMQFKKLVEVNGLSKNLYYKYKPLHERFAQRLFFAVADSYCEADDLDISREPDAGSGPVDFKFSHGYRERVLVETKLTSSKRVVHGFVKQLPAYQESEGTKRGFYVVIRTTRSETQIKELLELKETLSSEGKRLPSIVVVDARLKPSASRR